MIRRERVTATVDGDFVVFLIGMRINRPLMVHRWMPVATAMTRMLRELHRRPELGFLAAETWFGRTFLVLQYWRSMDHLIEYSKNTDAEHLPAWRAFNRAIGTDGSVGIWHETYLVSADRYENIYVNMPTFGLARVGVPTHARGGKQTAAGRLRKGADRGSGLPDLRLDQLAGDEAEGDHDDRGGEDSSHGKLPLQRSDDDAVQSTDGLSARAAFS